MPMSKEVLETIAGDIAKAESSLADLKDVVSDMRLSGMDVTTQEAEVKDLSAKLRSMKMFYELRKAKA
ncbi:unnamed protein product [marine sediment metagenome]|uniref:Uncharacterized protein n=1 Tax=marine sediment metagenome TaxID=412755 RepID=X1V9M8_9ZZZZ